MLFFDKNNKLTLIKEKRISKESEIQTLVENNLTEIFGLELVKSEFAIENFRFDTLAYDAEANTFVIIEYKSDQNYSVVDQ